MCSVEFLPRRERCPGPVGNLCHQVLYFCNLCKGSTVVCCLTTGIRYEKCVVRLFRRCANVIGCTYTNQDSTV